MRALLFTLLFSLLGGALFAQIQVIEDFNTPLSPDDSTYFQYITSDNADPEVSHLELSWVTDPVHEGSHAMKMDYAVQNSESYGGFYKIERWYPDTTKYWDLTNFDSLYIWFYNSIAQDSIGAVEFRLQMFDASNSADGPATRNANNTELYYSFHTILDMVPGWNRISMVLDRTDSYDGTGFTYTGWSGQQGNGKFDKNRIVGFGMEFSIGGAGEGDVTTGQIIFDDFMLHSLAEKPVAFFNGKSVPGNVTLTTGGWGSASYEITDEETYDPETTSIKLNTGTDAWNGLVFALDETVDLQYRWSIDSVKFNIKAPADMGALRLVMLDDNMGDGDLMYEASYDILPENMGYDGSWKEVAVPLSAFNRFAGGWDGSATQPGEMDSSRVIEFRIVKTDDGKSHNKVVYFDNIWTGNPTFDNVPPEAPQSVTAAAGTYVNTIVWLDVVGEENETYDVYYSTSPITEITEELEVLALGIEEGTQTVDHVLRAPATDQTVDYYYAIVCVDAAGNLSTPGQTASSVSNTAKGVTVINWGAPSGFAADGSISEWSGVTPFRMYPSDGSGSVVTNTEVDNDADLSADIYLAFDNDYIYFAFDIEDNVFQVDSTMTSYLVDSPDLFIGLYNWHGVTHTAYQSGDEPDYHFRMNSNKVIIDNLSSATIMYIGENYSFTEKFPSGYVAEGKISFDALSALSGDVRFIPSEGQRIPIDFSINDNDTPNTDEREGIMSYSPFNEDESYQDVSRWLYTWVGPEWVSGVEEDRNVLEVNEYYLSQNYPNPFNPSTNIKYSIKEAGMVSMKIFNVLGQEVATLINQYQNKGSYVASFDASQLASGVYIYQIKSGNFVASKKMMLIK